MEDRDFGEVNIPAYYKRLPLRFMVRQRVEKINEDENWNKYM
jgi:hypothetical protein